MMAAIEAGLENSWLTSLGFTKPRHRNRATNPRVRSSVWASMCRVLAINEQIHGSEIAWFLEIKVKRLRCDQVTISYFYCEF